MNILFYIIYMDSVCEDIKNDKMEEDSKKIDCYAIFDLIKDTIDVY